MPSALPYFIASVTVAGGLKLIAAVVAESTSARQARKTRRER
jgi:ABC-type nitrate/sulfonate/bicarbonate transport system permease component